MAEACSIVREMFTSCWDRLTSRPLPLNPKNDDEDYLGDLDGDVDPMLNTHGQNGSTILYMQDVSDLIKASKNVEEKRSRQKRKKKIVKTTCLIVFGAFCLIVLCGSLAYHFRPKDANDSQNTTTISSHTTDAIHTASTFTSESTTHNSTPTRPTSTSTTATTTSTTIHTTATTMSTTPTTATTMSTTPTSATTMSTTSSPTPSPFHRMQFNGSVECEVTKPFNVRVFFNGNDKGEVVREVDNHFLVLPYSAEGSVNHLTIRWLKTEGGADAISCSKMTPFNDDHHHCYQSAQSGHEVEGHELLKYSCKICHALNITEDVKLDLSDMSFEWYAKFAFYRSVDIEQKGELLLPSPQNEDISLMANFVSNPPPDKFFTDFASEITCKSDATPAP